MIHKSDVLVVGGGVTGTMAAITLAEHGAHVTVLDAGKHAGSDANAGSLHVQMQSRFMRLYPDQVANVEAALPFYRQAADLWEQLDTDLGGVELIRKGGLMLAESADQLDFLAMKAKREQAHGVSVTMLDRPALDRLAPWLGPQIVGAELCADEGKLNPLIANKRLHAKSKSVGVDHRRLFVKGLERLSHGLRAHTDAGVFEAEQVVLAAAWGSGALTAQLGLSIPSHAEPLHMNITEPADVAIPYLVQHAERSITLKQFSSGQIVIGGGWVAENRGPSEPPGVIASSLLSNVALAARLAPGIGQLRLIRTWAGINTTTDGASILGRLPTCDRLVMALPGDAGYTLGPLVGMLAANIALAKPPTMDIERFAPDRFAS